MLARVWQRTLPLFKSYNLSQQKQSATFISLLRIVFAIWTGNLQSLTYKKGTTGGKQEASNQWINEFEDQSISRRYRTSVNLRELSA